jgi:ankyrin repeat protein
LLSLREYTKQKQVDVNAEDDASWTPLMIAVSIGDASLVQKLLSAGADPTIKNATGQSPLFYAASKNRAEVGHCTGIWNYHFAKERYLIT